MKEVTPKATRIRYRATAIAQISCEKLASKLHGAQKRVVAIDKLAEPTQHLAPVVGRVTAVASVAYLGAFTDYESAAALEKACGLGLKIRSSGNYVGRLKLTKRGSAAVRRYLYLAALRLIQNDPLIARWYRARAGYRGGPPGPPRGGRRSASDHDPVGCQIIC